MRKLLLFLTCLLVFGCEMPQQGFWKKTVEVFEEYSENTIQFKENIIVLSDGYAQTSPEEFKTRLDSLTSNKKVKKLALKELEKLQKMNTEFQIYADGENVGNYVFVYARNYIQFDEHSAAKQVSRMNNVLKDESNVQEVRYKRIHGRYFYTPVSKIVKLKYIKDKKFQTEYIVASQRGGLGLLVSNFQDVDFEESIKSLALK